MAKRRKTMVAMVPVVAGAAVLLSGSVAGATSPGANPGTFIGPRTTVNPYVLPVNASNTQITSLLTVDDQPAVNGYPMTGIPDGLWAPPPTAAT